MASKGLINGFLYFIDSPWLMQMTRNVTKTEIPTKKSYIYIGGARVRAQIAIGMDFLDLRWFCEGIE